MEIKIDMNGSYVELTTFLHSLMINHSQKEETPVKTANTCLLYTSDAADEL